MALRFLFFNALYNPQAFTNPIAKPHPQLSDNPPQPPTSPREAVLPPHAMHDQTQPSLARTTTIPAEELCNRNCEDTIVEGCICLQSNSLVRIQHCSHSSRCCLSSWPAWIRRRPITQPTHTTPFFFRSPTVSSSIYPSGKAKKKR
jgi:hypothetical protein